MVKISLCIPTMDRFDKFLKVYLTKYINSEYIAEIIICDENGNDAVKILKEFPDVQNLYVYVNDKQLGPLLNKIKCCKMATYDWIALMDSDNFADDNYFLAANKYINSNNLENHTNIVLSPTYAKPNFNLTHLAGMIYKKGTFKQNRIIEKSRQEPEKVSSELLLMNVGNYIICKNLILSLDGSLIDSYNTDSCDVIYLNTLLFTHCDMNLHVVKDMGYKHVVHEGSVYIKTHQTCAKRSIDVSNEYNKLQ
uniref:Glycosyltransferase 2-like domain-containing protein n=1 Tax=viral metagenome TaxID=1070528 RepID=A0A6C0JAH6_9ZZZZ